MHACNGTCWYDVENVHDWQEQKVDIACRGGSNNAPAQSNVKRRKTVLHWNNVFEFHVIHYKPTLHALERNLFDIDEGRSYITFPYVFTMLDWLSFPGPSSYSPSLTSANSLQFRSIIVALVSFSLSIFAVTLLLLFCFSLQSSSVPSWLLTAAERCAHLRKIGNFGVAYAVLSGWKDVVWLWSIGHMACAMVFLWKVTQFKECCRIVISFNFFWWRSNQVVHEMVQEEHNTETTNRRNGQTPG